MIKRDGSKVGWRGNRELKRYRGRREEGRKAGELEREAGREGKATTAAAATEGEAVIGRQVWVMTW